MENEYKPGYRFYRVGDDEPWHIVTCFTDDGQTFYVIKSWNKWRQAWFYKTVHDWDFELAIEEYMSVYDSNDYPRHYPKAKIEWIKSTCSKFKKQQNNK